MKRIIASSGILFAAMLVFLFSGDELAAQNGTRNDLLLAASSPFEDLTEFALAGNEAGMQKALHEFSAQSAKVRATLSVKARADLDSLVAEIGEASSRKDFASVALKSVEVYRILIDALDGNSMKVPVQVSLLDYAGFRFTVLLHQRAVNWPMLLQAAEEAQQNWKTIRLRVADQGLRDLADSAIAGMNSACTGKNAGMAAFAAKIDLDMVDLLEAYFERIVK